MAMTFLLMLLLGFSDSIITEKGGHCFFVQKNPATLDIQRKIKKSNVKTLH